jgi:alkylhydroperoxidase family enzyme
VSPAKTTPLDLDKLRQAGFTDADILDAAQVISYFNYINRIADGLGVDLESWMKRPESEK